MHDYYTGSQAAGIAPYLHLVHIWWYGLAADSHPLAVNEIAILPIGQPPHHDALLRRHHCRASSLIMQADGGT